LDRKQEEAGMKRIPTVAVLWLAGVVALMAQAPTPAVRCKGADGRACTSGQVQALSDAVYAGKNHHEVLAPVRSLTLAKSDGTLKCEQSDGKPCTTPQLDAIKQIAADQQMYINYNSSK
jgi:hypothetical protein